MFHDMPEQRCHTPRTQAVKRRGGTTLGMPFATDVRTHKTCLGNMLGCITERPQAYCRFGMS
jgi:hypothetical protein